MHASLHPPRAPRVGAAEADSESAAALAAVLAEEARRAGIDLDDLGP
jgi:hypothetical protein